MNYLSHSHIWRRRFKKSWEGPSKSKGSIYGTQGGQTGQRARTRLFLKQNQNWGKAGAGERQKGVRKVTGFRESKRSTRTGRRASWHCLAHLAGGVVEHLLPCGVQPVLVSHDALLSHKHHLPGSVVHAHSPLIPQCCLLCLLLGLGGRVGKDLRRLSCKDP